MPNSNADITFLPAELNNEDLESIPDVIADAILDAVEIRDELPEFIPAATLLTMLVPAA